MYYIGYMKNILIVGSFIVLIVGTLFLYSKRTPAGNTYDPQISPADFSSEVTNMFFTLEPGTVFVYEAEKAEGHERIEVTVLSETRMVMGVEAVIVKDQVFLDGELIEDTRDWYAEDLEGNVWYFGEETAEYEGGVMTTTAGSWEAGIDGAKPGLIMKANPQVGDSYRLEYYAGEAEDMADVVTLNESLVVPAGAFTGCLKTYDYTPLDPNAKEYKYYCPEVQGVALEVNIEDNERMELISVKNNTAPAVSPPPAPAAGAGASTPPVAPSSLPPPQSEISEAQARTVALERVPGVVTDVSVEVKFGKKTYVVEVKPTYGAEKDVIIDIQTGAILAVE